jgi:PAS domain S-box-containing protein
VIDSSEQRSSNSFGRVALLGGAAAVFIGILGLLGWMLRLPVLTSLNPSYIPIASSTCLGFLIQGAILILQVHSPRRARQWPLVLLVAVTSIFGMLTALGYFTESELNLERSIFSSVGRLGAFPTNRMSPLTGLFFGLSGTALLLLQRSESKALAWQCAGGLASLVALAGLVGSISYVYGTPLLYRSTVIPMALTTSLAFLLLGSGLVAAAGPAGFLLRPLTGASVRAKLLRTFIPLGFMAVIGSGILLSAVTWLHSALVLASSAVFFAVVTVVVVVRAARMVGDAIEHAEEERNRSIKALRESERRFKTIFDNVRDGILLANNETQKFHMGNPAICEMLGYAWDELRELTVEDLHPEQDLPYVKDQFERQVKGEIELARDIPTRRKDGSVFRADINAFPIQMEDRTYLLGVFRDVTASRRAEEAQRVSLRFLEIVHEHQEMAPMLREFVAEIKAYTGCDAVGIRVLDEAGNIPYQAYEGFSQRFFELENPLSLKEHQCMCINVIRGDVDAALPFYTQGGSFCVNATSRFLATVSEEDKGRTRNQCNLEGYETVALVPFRRGEQIFGLIHVADHREDMVPPHVVEVLEKAALQLGTAFLRTRAETKLRESEERFRSVFEDSPVGMGVIALDGRQLRANRAFCEMLGYTEEEFVRMHIDDFTHPEDRELGRQAMARLIAAETDAVHMENRYLRKDGGVVWALVHASVTRDRTGKPMFLSGQVLDITERKESREKIEHLNRVLRAIRDVNQLIVQERDPKRLIQKTCQLLVETRGYLGALIVLTDAAGLPTTYAEAGLGEAFQSLGEDLKQGILPPCCNAAQFHEGTLVITDRSGFCSSCRAAVGYPPCDSMCIRLQHDQTIHGYLAVSVPRGHCEDEEDRSLFAEMAGDVSFALHSIEREAEAERANEERRRAETQLRQAQKMEALGTLAGGIAHDFNNILGIVVGYTEMARWEVGQGSKIDQELEEVLKAAHRAKELVKQILAFSRHSEQERMPVQVGLIVKEALKMLRASLPSTVDISMEVRSDAFVLADPTQIHQVLMNLCTNAAHAMEEKGGVLGVGLADVSLGPEAIPPHSGLQPGAHVRLTVRDTGQGMDPAILERIFDPFFTTKAPGVGTGLGLSVVHGIVKSHGGMIEVASSPGKGTSFHVLLPIMESASALEAGEAMTLPRGQERIVIVDDEPALAMVVRKMLERLGYEVEHRTSSVEAFQDYCRQPMEKPFDLLITDMTMPHLTGLDLVRELHRYHPSLPVVLCTGFSEKIDPEKIESLGIQGFLTKPVVMKELAELVRKVLDARTK